MFTPDFDWNTVIAGSAIIIQVVGFGIGFLIINYQFKKQREVDKQNLINEINVGFYKQLLDNLSKASPLYMSTTLDMVLSTLQESLERAKIDGKYLPPIWDLTKIDKDGKEVSERLFTVVEILENYEIIIDKLDLFRKMLIISVNNYADAYISVIQALPYLIPSEKGIKDPDNVATPTKEQLSNLKKDILDLTDCAYDVAGYLYDIRVEVQNKLLGDVYEKTLPIRKRDDGGLVLTTKDKKMLEWLKCEIEENEKLDREQSN